MAKVKTPLLSFEARNKLADSIVFFPWKGRNVVRQWRKPTNPRSIGQMIIRQKLASMGKNLAIIETPKTGLLDGSKMYQMLKDVTPATQIWNAYFVEKAMDYVKTDANFAALSAALYGTAAVSQWTESAIGLGFETLTDADIYATQIPPELQLFMGAYAAYLLELSSYTDIYNTYPSTWALATITHFATDYYTVTA